MMKLITFSLVLDRWAFRWRRDTAVLSKTLSDMPSGWTHLRLLHV